MQLPSNHRHQQHTKPAIRHQQDRMQVQ
jgi:hypothetical protein